MKLPVLFTTLYNDLQYLISCIYIFVEDVRALLKKTEFYRSVDYNPVYYTVHEAVIIANELNSLYFVSTKQQALTIIDLFMLE